DLIKHAFVVGAPFFAATISKGARKGGGIELSGSDSYNSIILPLQKALEHLDKSFRPNKEYKYFDCLVSLPVCVVDGPMIVVDVRPQSTKMRLAPWIRVLRRVEDHEARPVGALPPTIAIDFVHRAFLRRYLRAAEAYADVFASRALRHAEAIAAGRGFV